MSDASASILKSKGPGSTFLRSIAPNPGHDKCAYAHLSGERRGERREEGESPKAKGDRREA
jgi:hypothetical protein